MKIAFPDKDPGAILFHCPACDGLHRIQVGDGPGPRWKWNGNHEKPTFTPSVKCTWEHPPLPTRCCHFFVRDGRIDYCSDCTHALAGKSVDLPDMDDPVYG